MKHIRWLAASGAAFLLLVAGCGQSAPTGEAGPASRARVEAARPEVEVDGVTYLIGEPLTHKNVTVFVLSCGRQDERDFLTLDEGLKGGQVTITEQDQERVGTLQIENRSDRPLYLQEGERLTGGKQDRIIASSLVVPPGSGKVTMPTFCVEQSRWVEGDKGRSFGFTVNAALAPKGVRGAAKVEDNQHGVWNCVGASKVTAQSKLKSANTNSSVNEFLDDPAARSVSDDYAGALAGALTGPEVVGVAVAVNGQIEEVNVYPNSALFRKLYPRLVQSYALQAKLLEDQAMAAEPLSIDAVISFLKPGAEKSSRDRALDTRNSVRVRRLEDNKFQCETRYDGKLVHWQAMKKNGTGNAPRCAALGGDW
jgi:hypothetical protein